MLGVTAYRNYAIASDFDFHAARTATNTAQDQMLRRLLRFCSFTRQFDLTNSSYLSERSPTGTLLTSIKKE
jgi:hypothetical protein